MFCHVFPRFSSFRHQLFLLARYRLCTRFYLLMIRTHWIYAEIRIYCRYAWIDQRSAFAYILFHESHPLIISLESLHLKISSSIAEINYQDDSSTPSIFFRNLYIPWIIYAWSPIIIKGIVYSMKSILQTCEKRPSFHTTKNQVVNRRELSW